MQLGGKAKARRVEATANSDVGIDLFWAKLKKKVKGEGLRILLSDDISYVIRLTVPDEVELTELRGWVLGQIRKYIPEQLDDDNWDYMLGDGKLAPKNKLVVFAPVGKIWELVSGFLNKYKINVETVEPVSASGMRHKDPVVGIASKPDSVMEADDPYNLSLEVEKVKAPEKVVAKVKDSQQSKKGLSVGLMFVIFGIVATVFGYVVWSFVISPLFFPVNPEMAKFRQQTEEKKIQIEEVAEQTLTPTPTAGVESTDVNGYKLIADLQVQVLNGSGKAGVAKRTADILAEQGVQNVSIGNAISYNYDQMLVGFSPKVDPDFQDKLLTRFKSEGYVPNIDENILLTAASEADIVIIVIN